MGWQFCFGHGWLMLKMDGRWQDLFSNVTMVIQKIEPYFGRKFRAEIKFKKSYTGKFQSAIWSLLETGAGQDFAGFLCRINPAQDKSCKSCSKILSCTSKKSCSAAILIMHFRDSGPSRCYPCVNTFDPNKIWHFWNAKILYHFLAKYTFLSTWIKDPDLRKLNVLNIGFLCSISAILF